MAYVQRDASGNIIGIYANPQDHATEWVDSPVLFVAQIPLSQQAQTALDKSDITMLRCVDAGVIVPTEWNTYRKSLRAIASGKDTTSTTLPVQPSYPAGT